VRAPSSDAVPPSTVARAAAAAGWALLLAFAALLALQSIRSNDYWWHLRAGQWIWEHGRVPLHDPFSYSVPGARWIDIHWLFQLGLYAGFCLGGHAAAVLAKLATVLALLGVLVAGSGRAARTPAAWWPLGAMLVVLSTRLMPRPELSSFVLLALVQALLVRSRRTSDRWLYAVVPLQLLWANVHGLFAVGVVLCGIEWLAEALRLARSGAGAGPARLRRLSIVTVGAAAVALLNPNGLDGALYPLLQLGMVGPEAARGILGALAFELQPLLVGGTPVPPRMLAALSLLVVGSLFAMLAGRRHLHPADWLAWVALLYLALAARRNAALFAIVAASVWLRCWGAARARAEARGDARGGTPRGARGWPGRAGVAAAAAAVLALAVGLDELRRNAFYPHLNATRELGLGVEESFTPSAVFDWIRRERPPGPIAHGLDSSGPMIWHLHPDYRVLLDGRLEVYGGEQLLRHWIRTPSRLEALAAEYDFGAVLLYHTRWPADAIVTHLAASPAWKLAYVDDVSLVFVRERPDTAHLPAVDVRDPALFPPLDGPPGPGDRRRRVGRARFLHAVGLHGRALAEWERALERYPELPHGRFHLSALQLAARDHHAAVRSLEALLRDPTTAAATLAQAARLSGRAAPGLAARLRAEAARREAASWSLPLRSPGVAGPLAVALIGVAGAFWLAAGRPHAGPASGSGPPC